MSIPPPDGPHTDAPAKPDGRAEKSARTATRLKAALKANMARRKAQGRARAANNENKTE